MIGRKVAVIKEQKSNDPEIKLGKKFEGNKIPTSNDFVKSGVGKNNNPPNNPKTIEK